MKKVKERCASGGLCSGECRSHHLNRDRVGHTIETKVTETDPETGKVKTKKKEVFQRLEHCPSYYQEVTNE